MNCSKRDTIYRVAEKVRAFALWKHETDDTAGLCDYASKLLIERLDKIGIDAKLIRGTFAVDFPYDGEYNPLHYWIEIDNYIVDVTADQFNHEIEDDLMDEIVIDTYTVLNRYTKVYEKCLI